MRNKLNRRDSVVAFRATPAVAVILKALAASENRTLSSWMNLRAQEIIGSYQGKEAENGPTQERLL